jgi:type IV secretory pathway VirB3-like protein
MKLCEKCKKPNPIDKHFCASCGAPFFTVNLKKDDEVPDKVSHILADGERRTEIKSEAPVVAPAADNSSPSLSYDKILPRYSFVPIRYQPSEKWNLTSFFLVMLLSAVFSTILGVLYAYVCNIIPIKLLNLIPCALWLTLVFVAIYLIFYIVPIRSPNNFAHACTLGFAFGYFAHWAFWCAMYEHEFVFKYFWNLTKVVNIMSYVANTEKFRMLIDKSYSGFILKFAWLLEMILYFLVVSLASRMMAETPCAEDSGAEFKEDKEHTIVVAAPSDPNYLNLLCNALRAGNFDYFLNREILVGDTDKDRFKIEFSSAKGSSYKYVKVERIYGSAEKKKGENEPETETIVEGSVPENYIKPTIDLIDKRKKAIGLTE